MISWMQKHKRYLIVTIWISTIAFVGAGFVGWGSYTFSDNKKLVAKVQDTEIGFDNLQSEYSRIYSFYAQLFGDNFNQELAKNLKLEDMAVKNLIENAIWINLATEFGLVVLDEEITNEIIQMEAFQTNGNFDKERYIATLNRAGFKPKDFEDDLRESLLVQKIQNALTLNVTDFEKRIFNDAMSIEDNVSIEVVSSENLDSNHTENDMKKFWETKKDDYKTQRVFNVKLVSLKLDDTNVSQNEIVEFYNTNKDMFRDENGSIMSLESAFSDVQREVKFKTLKKEALKVYLEVKKSESNENVIELEENSSNIAPEVIKAISVVEKNETIKPIQVEDGFVIVKLLNKKEPRVLSFEEAKNEVEKEFLVENKKTMLKELATKSLETFKGTEIGFISKNTPINILSFDEVQSGEIIEEVFKSKSDKGYLIVEDKAVLFKINSQRFAENNQSLDTLSENIGKIKDTLISQNVLQILEKKYKINLYYKGN